MYTHACICQIIHVCIFVWSACSHAYVCHTCLSMPHAVAEATQTTQIAVSSGLRCLVLLLSVGRGQCTDSLGDVSCLRALRISNACMHACMNACMHA